MFDKMMFLREGALLMGIISTFVAMGNFIYAIAMYEGVPALQDKFQILGDASEYTFNMFNIAFSLIDLLAAAVLVVGILMKKPLFLLPWIIMSIILIIQIALEYWLVLLHSIAFVFIFGGVLFIWFCILTLYKIMRFDEKLATTSGVQMTFVEETSSQPYSVLTNQTNQILQ